MIGRLTSLFFLAGSLLSACAAPELGQKDARLEALTEACGQELAAIHAAGSFPGATATVVLANGQLIRLAVGETEAGGRALTPDDRMLAGSVGKTWVATVIHQLIAMGPIDYESRAARWLGEDEWFERLPNSAEITVRQLLRHQSGLEPYEYKPAFWRELMLDSGRVWKPEELLAFVLDDEPLFPAGEGWAYADTNYILLGMIIERASGRRFYDLVWDWTLRPHGLEDTIPSDRRRLPKVVQGTVRAGQQFGVGPRTLEDGLFTYNVQFEWCGGGFASTSTDLARWARLLFSGQMLGAGPTTTMLEVVPAPELGPNRSYGLGVIVTETRLGLLLGHDGFMPGYLTAMGYFPDAGIAVAVQVNTDDSRSVGMPLHEVLVRLVERVLESSSVLEEASAG